MNFLSEKNRFPKESLLICTRVLSKTNHCFRASSLQVTFLLFAIGHTQNVLSWDPLRTYMLWQKVCHHDHYTKECFIWKFVHDDSVTVMPTSTEELLCNYWSMCQIDLKQGFLGWWKQEGIYCEKLILRKWPLIRLMVITLTHVGL